jgi:drug/metabolite transporter (DMT)-like permease
MIWLIISVLCSAWLVVSFKLFSRWQIPVLPTIAVNYLVCVLTAWALTGQFPIQADALTRIGWLPVAIGTAFVITFTIVAITVARNGVSVASVMQKMSLLITVLFSFMFYKEAATMPKIAAIILSLAAVVLTNWPSKTEKASAVKAAGWLFPVLALLGSGVCDIGILYSGKTLATKPGDVEVISMIFASAGIVGLVYYIYCLVAGTEKWDSRVLWAGVLLGIPNYGSLYCLLQSLPFFNGEAARMFPTANLSVIAVSVLVGLFAFGERPSLLNWIGLGLAGVAISLMIL